MPDKEILIGRVRDPVLDCGHLDIVPIDDEHEWDLHGVLRIFEDKKVQITIEEIE